MRILVTGGAGLIGRALCAALRARGDDPVPFDLVDGLDVRDAASVRAAARSVDGVVHLAAVSRVVWGERDPSGCAQTNVGGTERVIEAAADAPNRPWVLFASSREVYGEVGTGLVDEDAPLRPINVYGRTKVDGEGLVLGARARGVATGVLRLSNVYGAATDHVDRVIPAFARAAAEGGELRVDGAAHTFDFTWLGDVVDGWLRAIDLVHAGAVLPPIHLVSGRGVTLLALAELAIRLAGRARPGGAPSIRLAAERDYDVRAFVGDPARAARLLGWRATTDLEQGLDRLVRAFVDPPIGRPSTD